MKNNILSYLKIRLQKSAKAVMYMTIIAVIITAIYTYGEHSYQLPQYNENFTEWIGTRTIYRSLIATSATVMICACYIAAVMNFSTFMKRRNLDCYYALPLSRRAIGTVHYLVGLINVVCIFTASYITNIVTMLMANGNFRYIYLLPYYFVSLLIGAIIYSVLVFVFNEGTSVVDGIIYMICYTFAPMVLCTALLELTSLGREYLFSELSTSLLFGLLLSVTEVFENAVEVKQDIFTSHLGAEHIIAWSVIWLIIGVAAAVGFFLRFGKRRPELTEDVSESYFGYKVIIPYMAAMIMLSFDSFDLLTLIFIEVAAFVGYTIYRRGFKYKKQDIITLAALVICEFF